MTSKRLYLSVLLLQSPDWIRGSLGNPTRGMTPVHLALHRLALRRMGACEHQKAPRVPFVDVSWVDGCKLSNPIRCY